MKMMIKAIVLGVVLMLSSNVFAASLLYAPESASVTVGPGMEAEISLNITLKDASRGTYYLWFIDSVTSGNLPVAWLEASPATAFLSTWWPSKSANITIKVPDDAAPGTYSGYLFSRAMKAHEPAESGSGMFFTVVVPSKCTSAPTVEITDFGPEYIWPPNHKMETVSVSGRVVMPEGCSLIEVGYSIDDEYGLYTSTGEIWVDSGGNFKLYLPVEAWRKGQDKDGRHYVIGVYAVDESGIGASGFLKAVVPHDQGSGK